MKEKMNLVLKFARKHYYLVFALLAMLIPDITLRILPRSNIFTKIYVDIIATGFSLLWTGLFLFVCTVLLPKRLGRILYLITNSIFIIYFVCQYVYFKIFGQLFWLKSIVLAGEGADYLSYALENIDSTLILGFFVSLILMILSALKWRRLRLRKKLWSLALIPVALISGLHILLQPEVFNIAENEWDSWRKPSVVYKQFHDSNKSLGVCGIYQFAFRDLKKTLFPDDSFSQEDFSEVAEFFKEKGRPEPNQYTDLLKGKNVIAVMMESMDTWMINEKYTPTICYMMENGINFTNLHAPTFGTGHTFNSEFSFNTGYHNPTTSVSAVNYFSNQYPYSMANLFKNAGYTTNSFHFNESEFYNRGLMHKSLGYDAYNSFTDLGMAKYASMMDSNVARDDKVFGEMTKGEPFFDFVITYSAHLPFTGNDAKLKFVRKTYPELIDESLDEETQNCYLLAKDTDEFFRILLERLEADGLLEDTVIVAFTDHYNYGYSDEDRLKDFKKDALITQIPGFIFSPGIEHKDISKPAQVMDFLPTIANLFGLENKNCYIGNDLLDDNNPGFVAFEDSSWLDNRMYYVQSDEPLSEEMKKYIQEQNDLRLKRFKINDTVILGDYFAKNTDLGR